MKVLNFKKNSPGENAQAWIASLCAFTRRRSAPEEDEKIENVPSSLQFKMSLPSGEKLHFRTAPPRSPMSSRTERCGGPT